MSKADEDPAISLRWVRREEGYLVVSISSTELVEFQVRDLYGDTVLADTVKRWIIGCKKLKVPFILGKFPGKNLTWINIFWKDDELLKYNTSPTHPFNL